MEKISVIIPTYNREGLIAGAIQSALEQTWENIEVIVVDDASTDNTEAVVRGFRDSRVHYVKMEKNSGGASAPRNRGVCEASGDIIAFLDSDDRWVSQKLELQMRYWKLHPKYGMIYCPFYTCKDDLIIGITPSGETADEELSGDIFKHLLVRNAIGTPTMLMHKEAFQDVGGFDESCKCLEDWEFVLRFAYNYQIGCVRNILVEANVTPGSVTFRPGPYFETRCRIIAKYKKELWDYGLFDAVVSDVFRVASERGTLGIVKEILEAMLSE